MKNKEKYGKITTITPYYWDKSMSKKNNYTPLLNWENINAPTNKIDETNLANKGIRFEDVIEALLIAEYGEKQWRRTQGSYDGKRDFVYPYDCTKPDERWAECKNYADNISINVLSPTLFMAAIKQIPCIYFYSYSPLNDNALINIIQYAKITGKIVKIFDGHFLEQCIYSRRMLPDIASKFGDFPKALQSYFSRNKVRIIQTLLDARMHPVSANYIFSKGEKFFISIVLQNLSLETIQCQAHLESDAKMHSYAGSISCGNMEFGQILEFLFPCETLDSGIAKYCIHLIIDNQSKQINGKLTVGNAPYFFLADSESLDLLDKSVKSLREFGVAPIMICGGSGYGKTTLLQNVLNHEDICNSFQILPVQLDVERSIYFANLFGRIIGLNSNEHTPQDQAVEIEILRPYIKNYIQSAKHIVSDIVKLSEIIHKPFLFVVDDAQNLTISYISFLRELRNAADTNTFKIIFALNTDKMSYKAFLEQLSWDQHYENRPCKVISLQKFNRERSITYLKHRLGLRDIDSFFQNFDGALTPMELNRLVIDLQTSKIITQTEKGRFAIVDQIEFGKYLNQKCYSDFSLIEICKNLKQGDLPAFIVRYIALVGYLPATLIKRFKRTIDSLIRLCILKIDRERVVFYHDTIKEKACLLTCDSDFYADICSDDVSLYVKALCAFRTYGRMQEAIVYIENFFAHEPFYEDGNQRYNICLAIIENLHEILKAPFAQSAMQYIKTNLSMISNENSYEKVFQFLEKTMLTTLQTDLGTNNEVHEIILFLNKKYLDRCLSTRRNGDCIKWGYAIIEKTKTLENFPNKSKAYWLSHFFNRMAIGMERLSIQKCDMPVTEYYYHLSAEYMAIAGNPPELILQQVIDNFNRAYVYNRSVSLALVKYSVRQLENLKTEEIERKACLRYHICLLHYIEQRLTTPRLNESFIDEMWEKIAWAETADINRFYKFKLMMIKAYLLLERNRYSESGEFILKAERLAYEGEMRSNIYKLSYVKAQLSKFCPNLMGDPYDLSVTALLQFLDVQSYDIQRNINILHRLLTDIKARNETRYREIIAEQPREITVELNQILSSDPSANSYFRFHKIDFPII